MRYLLAMVLVFWTSSVVLADRYYCVVFSWDSRIPMPNKCHTWGTFVQTDDHGKLLREVTLSWAPKGRWLVSDKPTDGHHMSLKETLDYARERRYIIRTWGPYRIEKSFFDEAVKQHSRTDMKYKMLDGYHRQKSDGKTVNCIHCLSDTAGPHKTWILWGKWASASVVRHFNEKELLADVDKKEKELVLEILDVKKARMASR